MARHATDPLQRGPKGSFVYVAADGAVKVRDVTPGQQDNKQAVVSAGLKAGDVVVTTGFARLTDGAKISAGDDPTAAADGTPALHQDTGVAPPGGAPRAGRRRRDPPQGDQRSDAAPRARGTAAASAAP